MNWEDPHYAARWPSNVGGTGSISTLAGDAEEPRRPIGFVPADDRHSRPAGEQQSPVVARPPAAVCRCRKGASCAACLELQFPRTS